ncbi:unnamed protein product [Allacma fusca]|uniref:Tetraspanin n=1 Tax=Allacma fusca TaxID=39272 RepID=A0A8J2J366_9HEXA|nr:unnamed protein product [Allacma fusca]
MAGRKGKSNSGGLCCVQASLILFNVITLLGGVATLGIGAWLLHQSLNSNSEAALLEDLSNANGIPFSEDFKGISIVLVALGSLVTFISFLGCFGAFFNSRCLLLCYLVSVTLILILQLMVSVFAILYRQPVNNAMREELISIIQVKYRPNNTYAIPVDAIQERFECCGVNGYSDWFSVNAWPSENIVPDSCCHVLQNNTGCGSMNPKYWQEKGCIGQIQIWIVEQLHFVACAILAVVFLQLYGIIASTLLFYHTKSMDPYSSSQRTSTPYKSYSYERAGMM